jgi:hypothetical protein
MSTILDKLTESKDQPVKFKTSKLLKVRKGQDPITKISEYTAIVGGDYEKLESTIEKRQLQEAAGQSSDPKGLTWGEWTDYPYFIKHKDETYVRLTRTNGEHGSTLYMRNNLPISKEEAEESCLASEFPKKPSETEIFNVKVSSIISLD